MSINRVVDLIATCRPGRLTVLCGAGLSADSGLPLAVPFARSVLNELGPEPDDLTALISESGLELPFESYMEVCLDNSLDPSLLDFYGSGEPNCNHYLLQALAVSGRVRDIYTTNFDVLIERALASADWTNGREYKVLHEDGSFSSVGGGDGGEPLLIKLHGSIQEPGSVRTILRDVSARAVSRARQGAINRMVSSDLYDVLLVMGYSCSDHFDISPIVARHGPKGPTVVLVQHDSDAGSTVQRLPMEATGENPFQRCRGWVVRGDTNVVVRKIAETVGIDLPDVPAPSVDWQATVRRWHKSFDTDHITWSILAQLFYRIGRLDRALFYYKRALTVDRAHNAIRREGAVLTNMGLVRESLREHRAAVDLHTLALACFENAKDPYGRAAAHSNLGFSLCYLDTDQAREQSSRAVRLARRHGFKDIRANALNNLGLAHKRDGDYEGALTYYSSALAVHPGADLQGEATTLSNISTVHRLMGALTEAETYAVRARDLARVIGHHAGEVEAMWTLAKTLRLLEREREAMEVEKEAEEIARAFRLPMLDEE